MNIFRKLKIGQRKSIGRQVINWQVLLFLLLLTGIFAIYDSAYALYYYGGNGAGDSSRTMTVVVDTPTVVGELYVKLPVDNELLVKEDGQFVGRYIYMSSGTNINKCYLIIDSDERTSGSDGTDIDTITIFPDLFSGTITDGFAAGDSFIVIDRIYSEKSYVSANSNLTESGAVNGEWITWVNNGLPVVDAENCLAYNINADTGLDYVRLSKNIKLINASTSALGGVSITSENSMYYMWGDSDRPNWFYSSSSYAHSTKLLSLVFDETIDFSEVDATKIQIGDDSSGTNNFTLTAPEITASQSDGTTITFTLTDSHRDTIASWGNSGGKTILYVKILAGGFKDMAGNSIAVTDWFALGSWVKDTTDPGLSSWSLNMHTHQLTLVFDENMDVSTLDVTKITIQNASSPTSSYVLTANSTSSSSDGASVVIDIFYSDFNTIVEKSPDLAVSEETSYLTIASGAIEDMSGNSAATVSADGDGTYTANTVDATNFKITTSAGATMEAGSTKVITIKAYDSSDYLTPAYGGTGGTDRTLVFSGANAAPESDPPTYDYVPKAKNKSNTNIDFGSDTVITFTKAQGSTTLTLYCEETALIAASDTVTSPNVTTASGDRLSLSVSQGPFASGRHLAFSQQPSSSGTINVALSQQPIVSIRDVYGNQTDEVYSITLYDTTESDFYTDGPGSLTATVNPVSSTDGQAEFAGVKYDNINSGNPIYIYAYSAEAGTAFSSGITFSTADTTTVDAADTPVSNFNLTPTNDTLAEKFAVLKFKITDAGGDLQDTLVDRIQIAVGGTGANASTDIVWAGVYDGETQIATATGAAITDSLITFGSTPDGESDADLVSVTDSSSTEFTVYVYMKSSKLTATDGQTYTFDTDESKIGVDSSMSSQMASDSGGITVVTGTIAVSVSYLEIVELSTGNSSITIDAGTTNEELQIRATDANKNVDEDYTGLHSLLFTGLDSIGSNRPRIETTIIGSGTYISINFSNGLSSTGGVTLTVYKAETANLTVSEQNQSYSVFNLSVTVNNISANTITKEAGDAQTGAVTKQLSTPLTVSVVDTYGNPVPSEDVTFSVSEPVNGATLSSSVVATNSSGQAATYLTLGSVAGDYTVTANYSGGSGVSFTETAVTPSSLSAVSGTPQTKAVTLTLDSPFVVALTGAGAVPIPGETITFSIITYPTGASGQSLSASSGVTNSSGQVSTTLTLGNKTGDYIVRATYSALTVDFTATATAAAPYSINLSGPSSITAGSVSTVFTASIKDSYANLVNAGTSSVFSLSSTSGAGIFYSDASGTTEITSITIGADSSSTTFYYKDTATGSPTLTATRTSGVALTVSSATAAPTILPTGLSYFTVTGATTALSAGSSRTITVTAYDAYDNVKTNLGNTNIVFSGANSSPSPTAQAPTCSNSSSVDVAFGSDTLLSFSGGEATAALKAYKAESVAIKATSGAITTSDSNDLEFTVRHSSADHLKFSADIPTPGGGFIVGTAFPLGTLNAVDLYSNVCDGANGATAYAGSKSVNYTLSGTAHAPDGSANDTYTTTVAFTAGASTTTLTTTLYRSQSTTITVNASDLDGTDVASNSITLAAGPVNKLTFDTQPSTAVTANIVFSQQPVVAVADQYGNPVLSSSEQIILTASTTTGSYTAVTNGTLSGDSLSVVVDSGLATFSGIKYSYPESIYLRASANSGGINDVYSYQVAVSTATDLSTTKITAGLSDTVSSIANSIAEKTNVYSFKVTDAGTDDYGAAFKKVTINKSGSDTTGDWTNYIGGAYLTDGTTQFTGTIEANKIYFGTGNSTIYTISDGQNKTYTLSVYLKPSLPSGGDNKVLGFTMDANSDIISDTAASRFAAVDAIEDTATVTVTVTGFRITGTATMTTGGSNTLTITAIDANRNTDTDYSGYKALIFSGASDSPLENHPSCTNYGGSAVNFGSVTDIEFASGINSSTVTMSLYKAEIAYITATQGSITTSSTNRLTVTVSAGEVDRLSWYTQPEAYVVASAPWKTFVISVTDAYGNTTSSTADITVTPTGGTTTAGSTATVTAVAGLASFNNFAVTCSSYPGSVTLAGTAPGVGTDTGDSDAVTVEEQYSVTVNAKDSLTAAHLTEVTLQILNSSGTSVYGPTTANSPFTTNLSYGTYTINLTKTQYVDFGSEQTAGVAADGVDGSYDNDITWTLSMTSLEEATADYQVKSSFVYDETNEDMTIRLWLERRGKLVLNDSEARNVLGTASVDIYFETGGDPLVTLNFEAPDTSNTTTGVYKRLVENVLTSGGGLGANILTAGKTYYARCRINYGGTSGDVREYESGTTFTVTIEQQLSREIIGKLGVGDGETLSDTIAANIASEGSLTRSSVAQVKSDTASIVTATGTTLPAAITAAKTEIMSDTSDILTATETTIPARVEDARELTEIAMKSEILNRENTIRSSQTMIVRYRTYSGLVPVINVYNSVNTHVITNGTMTEISSTGIYEYSLTFLNAWGRGDFTITCSESTKGVMDAIIVTVLKTDIEQISGSVSSILGSTTSINTLGTVANSLNSQFSVIETALSKVGKDLVSEVKEAAASATALESVYTQLTNVAKQIKELSGETEGINLQKLYEVSSEKKQDMDYLKNKTQELKAVMDINQKMIENISDKPITQTWYEYR